MKFIAIPVLIFFSFFFSSLEAAIFSLNPYKFIYYQSMGNRIVRTIFSSKNRILTTILISNTFVNVLLSQISEKLFYRKIPTLLITILTTTFILIFGEYSPKIFGVKRKNIILKYFLPVFSIFYLIEIPINFILSIFIPFKEEKRQLRSKKFIEELLLLGSNEGTLQEIESKFSNSIISISKMKAYEIMIPKENYYFLNEKTLIEDILDFIPKNIKRFPVYSKHPENVIGIIDIKDILCEKGQLIKKIKPAVFVNENVDISELLKYLKRVNEKMLLITDDNNKLKGVIDIEHIENEFIKRVKG